MLIRQIKINGTFLYRISINIFNGTADIDRIVDIIILHIDIHICIFQTDSSINFTSIWIVKIWFVSIDCSYFHVSNFFKDISDVCQTVLHACNVVNFFNCESHISPINPVSGLIHYISNNCYRIVLAVCSYFNKSIMNWNSSRFIAAGRIITVQIIVCSENIFYTAGFEYMSHTGNSLINSSSIIYAFNIESNLSALCWISVLVFNISIDNYRILDCWIR